MTETQVDERQPPRSRSGFRRLHPATLPSALLILGLIIVALFTRALWDDAATLHEEQRSRATAQVAADIELRLATYVEILRGVRGLHDTVPDLDAREFETFIRSADALETFPGMLAVGWDRLVVDADVDAYEQLVRAQQPQLSEFSVYPRGADEYLVVEYLTPLEGSEPAMGFDIMSESRRATAVRHAVRFDEPTLTAPIELKLDEEDVIGLLMILPTYAPSGEVDGAAVGVFRVSDLFAAAAADSGYAFVVEDLGASYSMVDADPIVLAAIDGTEPDGAAQKRIDAYGRRWQISLGAVDGGLADRNVILASAIAGVGVTMALAWVLYATRKSSDEAQVVADELAEANHDLAVVGTRLDRGVRAAGILLWEVNQTTGVAWSSDHDGGGDPEEHFQSRIHPDDHDWVVGEPTPSDGTILEQEFRLADDHGDYRWVLSRSQTIHRGGDEVVIGAHVDVTERHEHLEVVEQLNDDLMQRNQSLQDFTHVASHDLRSPLRAIGALVGFLREDMGEKLAEEAEVHLERIDARVVRMSTLIDDLLMYSRAYRPEENLQSTDLCDMLDEIVETLDVPSSMRVEIDCAAPVVTLARTPLTMCVRNLVDNALKHHGGPTGVVSVDVSMVGDDVRVVVADDGQGIDPDHIGKIFEPFRRLNVDAATPGSGIGLSVIERSARVNGGRIEVESVHGEGATFTLWWPAERCDVDTATAPQPAGASV